MEFSFSSYSDIMGISYPFSSTTRSIPPPYHQVFINFRGEIREFVNVLVDELKDELVNVFVDEDAVRGEDLTTLFDEIDKSRIALTIFSEGYTESKWCLNELVKINECMKKNKLDVFPVFFNVEIEDVKKLEGLFGKNFRTLKRTYPDKTMTKKWKEALKSISGKFGRSSDFSYYGDVRFILGRYWKERRFAKLVTEEVKKMLTRIAKKEEEERIRLRRERERLAEAKRNSLWGKTKELNINPFLITMLIAPYLLLFICGILYFTGSFNNQSKLNGSNRWINNDRVVIL